MSNQKQKQSANAPHKESREERNIKTTHNKQFNYASFVHWVYNPHKSEMQL